MSLSDALLVLLTTLGLGTVATLGFGLRSALKREREWRAVQAQAPRPQLTQASIQEAERTLTAAHQAANEALAKLPLDPSDPEAERLLYEAQARLRAAKERVR